MTGVVDKQKFVYRGIVKYPPGPLQTLGLRLTLGLDLEAGLELRTGLGLQL